MRHDKYEYHRFTGADHTQPYYSSHRRIQVKRQQVPTWAITGVMLALSLIIFAW